MPIIFAPDVAHFCQNCHTGNDAFYLITASHCSLCTRAQDLLNLGKGAWGAGFKIDVMAHELDDAYARLVPMIVKGNHALTYPFSLIEIDEFLKENHV